MFPFIFQINMKNLHLSLFSKILLLLSATLFIGSIFVPMWRIELEAPQYPEGLVLQLHANKIAGDVDVINGLNHYIDQLAAYSVYVFSDGAIYGISDSRKL